MQSQQDKRDEAKAEAKAEATQVRTDRANLIRDLIAANESLQERVAELESGNGDVHKVRLELNQSNLLFKQLAEAEKPPSPK